LPGWDTGKLGLVHWGPSRQYGRDRIVDLKIEEEKPDRE
jgi:hypothetical protein